jgi:hypothetical protein
MLGSKRVVLAIAASIWLGGAGCSGSGTATSESGSGSGAGATGAGAAGAGGSRASNGGATGSGGAGMAGGGGTSGVPLPNKPHGLFILKPATTGAGYTDHVLPIFLCKDTGDPDASCMQKGAGYDAVKGVTFQFAWRDVMPANGTPNFSKVTAAIDAWRAAGKTANLVFQTVGYTTGKSQLDAPDWYTTPVAATISQDASGTITVTTGPATMDFFVGDAMGQSIQITGTTFLDGTYVVKHLSADHQTLIATGSQANGIHTEHGGSVGNPMLGLPCNEVPAPVFWGQNFINAWQAVMKAVHDQLDAYPGLGYLRFGLGIGGENAPAHDVAKVTMGVMECPPVLYAAGFTPNAPPWPNDQSTDWQTQVAKPVWLDVYQANMLAYLDTLGFTRLVSVSLSPIVYGSNFDWMTPDGTAKLAASHGFAIGDQGWQESDAMTAMSGGHCTGDYCALFPMNKGKVPLELQSVLASNPGVMNGTTTGNLVNMFPWAISQGAQILEIYSDDFGCTFDPNYTPTAPTPMTNTYQACQDAHYPAAFAAAAAALN